jgi:multicomponent Na+:H+ antiporter subunit B
METMLFRYAAGKIRVLMLLVSLVLLFRGHNEPGGGFIGGLIAASGYILVALAAGPAEVKAKMRIQPLQLMALGLFLAVVSTFPSLVTGNSFMEGAWTEISIFSVKIMKIGTPLLFDTGVYFTVTGFTLNVIFVLMEEWKWK